MTKSKEIIKKRCTSTKYGREYSEGARYEGRIVVPPVYRSVKNPVGRYCAMESYPGIWGVIAVDGKIEVEPRYEDVVIHTDGTVDLTVRPGKVITKKLP